MAGRTTLLTFKLALYASRPEHHRVRLALADAALDPADPDPDASFDRLAVDSLITDLALWEGGLAAALATWYGKALVSPASPT